jgi:hypothetical protein
MAEPKRVELKHEDRFPLGAYAVGVDAVAEWDSDRGRTGAQARDPNNGLPLWQVAVLDPDPEGRVHEVKVRIAASEEPVLPPLVVVPGSAHGLRPVWFGGLVGTPYLDSNGRRPRLAWSLRAESMSAPAPVGSAEAAGSIAAGLDGSGSAAESGGRRGSGGSGRSGGSPA